MLVFFNPLHCLSLFPSSVVISAECPRIFNTRDTSALSASPCTDGPAYDLSIPLGSFTAPKSMRGVFTSVSKGRAEAMLIPR